MDNKIITFVLVIAIGVLVGVGVATRQLKDPIMKDLASKQEEILRAQQRMEANVGLVLGQGGQKSLSTGGMQALEERIVALEQKLKILDPLIQQIAKKPSMPDNQMDEYNKVYTIDIAHSPVLGKKDAPVTVVEFVDFQCPFCARFHAPLMEAVRAFPNDVNFIVKNFPLSFHPQAKPASKAAFAAGEQGKYFEMVDALLVNGKELSEEKFKEIANDLGLNVEQFMKDYKDKDAVWEDYIAKDLELGEKVDVRGTPTFYINGKKTMARDLAGFKQEFQKIIDSKK